jgi:hypothetical protein
MFYGYCFIEKDGWHTPAVKLEQPENVWEYVNLQKHLFPEIRITDEDDFCVVQALDGKIAFPPEWVEMERMLG